MTHLNRLMGVLILALVVAAAGCGGSFSYKIKGTPRAPDADAVFAGEVLKDQAMTKVSIKAEHLTPPDRVQSGTGYYVVWARKDSSAGWIRIGGVAYNPKKRTGVFEGSVPESTFELQVTAEPSLTPAVPSGNATLQYKIK